MKFTWRHCITLWFWLGLAFMTLSFAEGLRAQDAAGGGKQVAADFAAQRATPGFVQPPINLWKTSVVAADNPAATMFLGPVITAGFGGLETGVAYEVELTFLSDGGDRAVRVTANGLDLEKQLSLPNGKVLSKRWPLPAEILDDGDLTLEVSTISGPNAVLSGVSVFANKPEARPLIALPRGKAKMVAGENAAQHSFNSFVQCNDVWKLAGMEDQISATEPLREMFFDGDAIKILLTGAATATAYGVELEFLSDSSDRTVSISAGGRVLRDQLALPKGRILRKYFSLPATAVKDGTIEITVAKVTGPNAILSGFAVFADNAGAKALVAPPAAPLPAELLSSVRLTPRPATVAAVKATKVDLAGTWKFNPAPPAEFWTAVIGADWKEIQVPGEWVMQGFTVTPNTAAGYSREFSVPADWNGQRVKLRCDAVYSDAKVWINGQEAGSHLGGFTPFELDVTKLLKPGASNTIRLAVKSESQADALACGSQYAAHPLGGIPRKIYLFAVPELNLADLYVRTEFDREFVNATLIAQVQIANDSAADSAPAKFELKLLDSSAKALAVDVPAIQAGQTFTTELRMPVASPRKWDSEHPTLYTLNASLKNSRGAVMETVVKRIGFRQVEVRGKQLFINNVPMKLHGVCRHETDPLRGRATTPEECRKDVELFRAMNVNHVRTSHYPPQEEFIEACNELGMFVEVEAPYCWADGNAKSAANLPYFLRTQMETTLRDRSEPSVIQWSLGNESSWGRNFEGSLAVARKLDNSRPCLFEQGSTNSPSPVDIDSPHYPGLGGVAQFDASPRPALFGEYAHLNCYNRRQFMTDPGLRDFWGEGIAAMWERMLVSPACLGGNVWAAIDDFFFLPSGDAVGYGNWGPLDGWRRAKPEYWHLKKIYSPVHIPTETLPLPSAGKPVSIPVQNRYFFSDLKELRFEWMFNGQTGKVANVAVAPGSKGELLVPLAGANPDGKTLELKAFSPLGFMVDAWRFTIGTAKSTLPPTKTNSVTLIKTSETLTVKCGNAQWLLDAKTGLIQQVNAGGKPMAVSGPSLMLLPIARWELDNPSGIQLSKMEYPPIKTTCSGWQASKVESSETADGVEIEIVGEYAEAKGRFLLKFTGDGRLTIDYDFKLKAPLNPMQLGVVFDLPRSCDTLSWKRKAQWSYYPDDHIGRAEGTAKASTGKPKINILGPHTQPDWNWSLDETELGANDFCSMKRNVIEAALRTTDGSGLRVIGGGTRHTRCWLDGERVRLLVADYANAGEGLCMNEYVVPNRPMQAGDAVTGKIIVETVPK